jgi:hypothetical protein
MNTIKRCIDTIETHRDAIAATALFTVSAGVSAFLTFMIIDLVMTVRALEATLTRLSIG